MNCSEVLGIAHLLIIKQILVLLTVAEQEAVKSLRCLNVTNGWPGLSIEANCVEV